MKSLCWNALNFKKQFSFLDTSSLLIFKNLSHQILNLEERLKLISSKPKELLPYMKYTVRHGRIMLHKGWIRMGSPSDVTVLFALFTVHY